MGHYEDFWWETNAEIKKRGLQTKFDIQLKKMQTQDKHKYKSTRDNWEYAYNKVIKNESNTR